MISVWERGSRVSEQAYGEKKQKVRVKGKLEYVKDQMKDLSGKQTNKLGLKGILNKSRQDSVFPTLTQVLLGQLCFVFIEA